MTLTGSLRFEQAFSGVSPCEHSLKVEQTKLNTNFFACDSGFTERDNYIYITMLMINQMQSFIWCGYLLLYLALFLSERA